jgi:hypothetical protein
MANMKAWLLSKGVRFDSSSRQTQITLRQLILFWYLCGATRQAHLADAKPVYYSTSRSGVVAAQAEPSAGAALGLLANSEVSPTCWLKSAQNYQVFVARDNIPGEKRQIRDRSRTNTYDLGWATVYESWDPAGVVFAGNPCNLYLTVTVTHEYAHTQQAMLSDVYAPLRNGVVARTTFLQLSGKDTTIYRIEPTLAEEFPSERGLPGVVRPAARSAEFKAKLTLPPGLASEWLKRELNLADNARVEPIKNIIDWIAERLLEVIHPLSNEATAAGPFFDTAWRSNFSQLGMFMQRGITTTLIPALAPATEVIDVVKQKPGDSLLENLDECLTEIARWDDTQKARTVELYDAVREICRTGLDAIQQLMTVCQVLTRRSMEVQKQTCQLFPNLVGFYTGYTDSYFKSAVVATRDRLREIIKTGDVGEAVYLPQAFQAALPGLKRRWKDGANDYNTETGLNGISRLDWYEIGAALGFFNNYTREYDAESQAMWTVAPGEFHAMYERAGLLSDSMLTEVLNQATFASVRGFEQSGRVPDYQT